LPTKSPHRNSGLDQFSISRKDGFASFEQGKGAWIECEANVHYCLEAGLDCRRFGILCLFRASRTPTSGHILCLAMRVSENGRFLDANFQHPRTNLSCQIVINNPVEKSTIRKGKAAWPSGIIDSSECSRLNQPLKPRRLPS
jgi:hypothetical protein